MDHHTIASSTQTPMNYGPVTLDDKLRLAASKGQDVTVKELIASGATFQPDREGRTALHYAALNGYADLVRFLIAAGADVDAQDNLGYTSLHRAAAQGHTEVIQALLDEACALDRQDEVHGNASLHEAAWNGYSRSLEAMVKAGANVNVTNKAGFTALHLSGQNGHNQSARVLLYGGCNSDAKNNYGDTALHTAARYGHAGVTRILISARCNINAQNKNDDTALHIAAALKRKKIAKILCEAKINLNLRNKQNETSSDVARRKDYPEILLIITTPYKKLRGRDKRDGGKKSRHKLRYPSDTDGSRGGGVSQTEDEAEAVKSDSSDGRKPTFCFGKSKKKKKKSSKQSKSSKKPLPVKQRSPSPSPPKRVHQGVGGSQLPPRSILKGTNTQNPANQFGFFNKYVPRAGSTYYKDLAGNVKQGPMGFAPICNCGPVLKKLDQKIESGKHNMYDHVDAMHQTLDTRIDQLERRTAQQVYAIDKLTKERVENTSSECMRHIDTQVKQTKRDTHRMIEQQANHISSDLKSWAEQRFNRTDNNGHNHTCDFYDPTNVPHSETFHDGFAGVDANDDAPMPGKLVRSRSDESLSASGSKYKYKLHKKWARDDAPLGAIARQFKEMRIQQQQQNNNNIHPHQPLLHNGHHQGYGGSGFNVNNLYRNNSTPNQFAPPMKANAPPPQNNQYNKQYRTQDVHINRQENQFNSNQNNQIRNYENQMRSNDHMGTYRSNSLGRDRQYSQQIQAQPLQQDSRIPRTPTKQTIPAMQLDNRNAGTSMPSPHSKPSSYRQTRPNTYHDNRMEREQLRVHDQPTQRGQGVPQRQPVTNQMGFELEHDLPFDTDHLPPRAVDYHSQFDLDKRNRELAEPTIHETYAQSLSKSTPNLDLSLNSPVKEVGPIVPYSPNVQVIRRPSYNTPNNLSPNDSLSPTTLQHIRNFNSTNRSKTDTGSNPDSGYSSKKYGAQGLFRASPARGCDISSSEAHNTTNSSIYTTPSMSSSQSSPITISNTSGETNDSAYQGQQDNRKYFNSLVSNEMGKWYERRQRRSDQLQQAITPDTSHVILREDRVSHATDV